MWLNGTWVGRLQNPDGLEKMVQCKHFELHFYIQTNSDGANQSAARHFLMSSGVLSNEIEAGWYSGTISICEACIWF
jgi:hypothetical protein